jgi:antitoxin component of MazEF toxin-antitoxin module
MGDWLKEAGFNEGNTVNVKVKHQKLIISLN